MDRESTIQATDPTRAQDHPSGPLPPAITSAPWWFEVLVTAFAAAVAAVGSAGLLLAFAGVFRPWLTLAVGLPVAAALVVAVGGHRRRASVTRPAVIGASLAIALAVGYVGFAGHHVSQNVLVNRDPASYTSTAVWLGTEGTLTVDARWAGFEPAGSTLAFDGAALSGPPDRLEFQFNHLTSVLLATVEALGGTSLLFRLPALLVGASLLAAYAVAVRATGRPLCSLLAPAILAASMPVLYVARDTYSEPVSMLLLWTGVLVLSGLHRRPSTAAGLAGGLILGATIAARVDALLFLGILAPAASLSIVGGRPEERQARLRAWSAAWVGATATGAIGIVDLYRYSSFYATSLEEELRLLQAAVVASVILSVVGSVLWHRLDRARRFVVRHRSVLGSVAGGGVAAVLFAAWLARPHLQVVRRAEPSALVEAMQGRDGFAVDGRRTYAEDSLRWMAWYLGRTTMALAIAGAVLAVIRGARGVARPATMGVVAIMVASGGIYWWRPSIQPDQVWAMRRFVPAVFPSLAILATLAVGALIAGATSALARRAPRHRWVAGGLATIAAVVLVVPAAATTFPLRDLREQPGHLDLMNDTCAAAGDETAVIVLGEQRGRSLTQGIRGWCGLPAARATPEFGVEELARVVERSRSLGRAVVLVADTPEELEPFASLVVSTDMTREAVNDLVPRRVLDGAPPRYEAVQTAQFVVARIAG